MKSAFLFKFILLFTIITSCKKGEEVNYDNTLIGSWKMSKYYYSTGGPLIYKNTTENVTINFKPNGVLQHSNPDWVSYHTDENYLTLVSKDSITAVYFYNINGSELNLSPAGAKMCIEGCGEIYKRIH